MPPNPALPLGAQIQELSPPKYQRLSLKCMAFLYVFVSSPEVGGPKVCFDFEIQYSSVYAFPDS